MKWWVYSDGLVCGPYYPETLTRRPSFTSDSLVCPEEGEGGAAAQWLRAGNVRTLRAMLEGRPFPPDPTLDDVADHRRLAERLTELESAARRQAAELKNLAQSEGLLRLELGRKDLELKALNARLAKAGSQMAAVKALEEGLRAIMEGLREQGAEGTALEARLSGFAAEIARSIDRADKAAAESLREAAGLVDATRAGVLRSIKAAEKTLAALVEERASAGAPPKKGGRHARRVRQQLAPSELGLPDAVPLDPPSF
ncbi:MAG: hypothetical protein HYZ75_14690 [Elusimicrobia bacterium]|nr:hypothetical protein [Elusimicrobiota bacterium]